MDKEIVSRLLHRPPDANKYDFGHVLVIGGSQGTTGAALMCAKAALRVGAGLVTIAAPADSIGKLERRVEEVMTLSLPGDSSNALETLQDFTNKRHVDTIVVGPGLSPALSLLCRQFLSKINQPIVLDAAGLLAFSDHKDELQNITGRSPVIITPHSGEYQRFIGEPLHNDENIVDQKVVQQARQLNLTIVLKGHHTLVAHPDGRTYRNPTGNPGMATAGSGDVLAGVIAGLLAQKLPVDQAAIIGVYIHGMAGDIAKKIKTEPGMIAGDIVENLPTAIKQLTAEEGVAL